MPNHPTLMLAQGIIADQGDSITVELVKPDSLPPLVRIAWPEKGTLVTPAKFAETAAAAMRILGNALVEVARMKGRRYRKGQHE